MRRLLHFSIEPYWCFKFKCFDCPPIEIAWFERRHSYSFVIWLSIDWRIIVSYRPTISGYCNRVDPPKLKYLELCFCFSLQTVEISATNLYHLNTLIQILTHHFKNVPILSEVSNIHQGLLLWEFSLYNLLWLFRGVSKGH